MAKRVHSRWVPLLRNRRRARRIWASPADPRTWAQMQCSCVADAGAYLIMPSWTVARCGRTLTRKIEGQCHFRHRFLDGRQHHWEEGQELRTWLDRWRGDGRSKREAIQQAMSPRPGDQRQHPTPHFCVSLKSRPNPAFPGPSSPTSCQARAVASRPARPSASKVTSPRRRWTVAFLPHSRLQVGGTASQTSQRVLIRQMAI
jgi:hypothetical protein